MSLEDKSIYTLILKADHDAYEYFVNRIKEYPDDIEIIKNNRRYDTRDKFKDDPVYKKLGKNIRDANNAKLDYINKNL